MKKARHTALKRTRQVAALPFRCHEDGTTEVLLVTSRETRRWVIPKGWPWPECEDSQAAAEEAWEEAGVTGAIGTEPIGSYSYAKRLENGSVRVKVAVYPLEVQKIKDKWPERKERRRVWYSPAEASRLVDERALGTIIRSIARRKRVGT